MRRSRPATTIECCGKESCFNEGIIVNRLFASSETRVFSGRFERGRRAAAPHVGLENPTYV
jgi:hypothetical protein